MAKIKTDKGEIEVKDGEPITEACEKLGVAFGCYEGICGSCRIAIIEGSENLLELTEREEEMGMSKNTRLACQCRINKGEVKIKMI